MYGLPGYYTLGQAHEQTGVARQIITALIKVHRIPTRSVGRAKFLDESAFQQLKDALREYQDVVVA